MSTEIRTLEEQHQRLMNASLKSGANAIRAEWKALAELLDQVPEITGQESQGAAAAALEFAAVTLERFYAFAGEWGMKS